MTAPASRATTGREFTASPHQSSASASSRQRPGSEAMRPAASATAKDRRAIVSHISRLADAACTNSAKVSPPSNARS